MILPRYYFEHPKSEKSVRLAGWSYVWAGLFGVGYVWRVGTGNLFNAMAVNMGFCGLFFVMLSVTSFLSGIVPLIVLAVAVPVFVFLNGRAMMSIIRTGYRRRGWMVRTD